MLKRLSIASSLLLVSLAALANPLSGGQPALEGGGGWMPEALRPLLLWLATHQREAMAALREQIGLIQSGQEFMPVVALVGAAFLYGIVHAAGPGHGKFVVGGFFLSRQASWRQGLALSLSIALIQAISAILLVAVPSLLLEAGSRQMMENAAILETVSYALIALLGLGLAWNAFRGNRCCSEPHVHGPNCQHAHQAPKPATRKELLASALAVGIRPCSGALLILIFTFANQIFWAGMLATLAMGLGTAITVFTVSLGAIGARRIAERLSAGAPVLRMTQRLIGVLMGLAIALAGAGMAAASLEQIV